MQAVVFIEEFVNAANGFERGGELLVFFQIEMFRREPFVEFQILHRFCQIGANAAQQNRPSFGCHLMEKAVEVLERNQIRIASALDAQHDVVDVT